MALTAASQVHTFWYIALGMGLVVVLVVIALMALLLRLVEDIDEGVEVLTATATDVAGNTAAIMELPKTAAVLSDIREEALIHHEFLRQQ
jgi:cytochrome bd-type quinol oxidase subunit 1